MSADDTPGGQRRIYPPHEVQARLGVSASGLRRLAGIYERTVGTLPRDDRGRVWPEEAIGELERARALVREQRAVSIEAALRGQEVETAATAGPLGSTDPGTANAPADPRAAILEELRALRGLVEEQNRRIAELEEAVRTGRELEAPRDEPREVAAPPESPGGQSTPGDAYAESSRGVWRRLADWFGAGRP